MRRISAGIPVNASERFAPHFRGFSPKPHKERGAGADSASGGFSATPSLLVPRRSIGAGRQPLGREIVHQQKLIFTHISFFPRGGKTDEPF
jgi:hypothetical protein